MGTGAAGDYQASIEAEKRLFENCTQVHDLPAIFHYWSNRYLRPRLTPLGFSDAPGMFRNFLDLQFRQPGGPIRRVASLGSGNCDLEIQLACDLRAAGHRDFIFDCLDLNPVMLQRARTAASAAGVESHLNLVAADLNTWSPAHEYDAVLACHSLHHVLNLENLFQAVERSLMPRGRFLVSDMIGRNGHQRWPEALAIVEEFWNRLPPSYRFHQVLRCYEETFENRDCSVEGFEGVRSQDILPLLCDRFHFHLFAGFANVIEPFVDRGFGPNFHPDRPWDRAMIDAIQARDQLELDSARLQPTQMMAVLAKEPGACATPFGIQPRDAIRIPEPVIVRASAKDPSMWGSWPHPAEDELRIACARLAESSSMLRERTGWAFALQSELEQRRAQVLNLETQFEQRTEWALSLERELTEHVRLAADIRNQLAERSEWARQLETERLRLENQVGAYAALTAQLESEIESRTSWALQMRSELEALRSAEGKLAPLWRLPQFARRLAETLKRLLDKIF